MIHERLREMQRQLLRFPQDLSLLSAYGGLLHHLCEHRFHGTPQRVAHLDIG